MFMLQPAAVESRYVCRMHQSPELGCETSEPGYRNHDNQNLDQHTSRGVDDRTSCGSPVTESSSKLLADGEEMRLEDEADGEEQLGTAADDDDDATVWIERSPCSSTSNDSTCRRQQYTKDVHPSPPHAPDVLLPDDNSVMRRRRRLSGKRKTVPGCHRAHALFAWKRAIVEWRVMSTVIDRLLFIIFLVITVLLYVIIFVVVPMTNSSSAAAMYNSPPVSDAYSHCAH